MDNTIETADLYLGALWYAKGMKFSGVRREGRQCWFMFANKAECQAMEARYYSQEETVVAKKYSDAVRTLKGLVFQ